MPLQARLVVDESAFEVEVEVGGAVVGKDRPVGRRNAGDIGLHVLEGNVRRAAEREDDLSAVGGEGVHVLLAEITGGGLTEARVSAPVDFLVAAWLGYQEAGEKRVDAGQGAVFGDFRVRPGGVVDEGCASCVPVARVR